MVVRLARKWEEVCIDLRTALSLPSASNVPLP